ncbi:MAG TPA: mechanosensitive ion channel, partial [Chloroflexi bacterium]|nr:mechanosensitive ion channel [Chloroflexota bacterium]
MLALWIIRHWLVSRLRRHAEQTKTPLDDLLLNLIERTRYPLLFLVALYLGALPLSLPDAVSGVIRIVAISTLLVQAGLWGNHAITFALTRWLAAEREEDPGAATTISALGFVSRLALWTVIVLLILDNLPNVEITSLIAGLGISGIAVALAVQNILQDLFASLSIVLDKPFVIGDFIIVDDLMGTVENIGLKTTRVRSLYGEELVFSNADLLGSRIRNYKRMHE